MKAHRFATLLALFVCCFLSGCGLENPSLTPVHVTLTGNVVFIGDSITFHWSGDPGFQSHANWIDKGINGQTSFEVALRFYNDVIALRPKTVHIIVGTNDVYPGWQSCAAPQFAVPDPGDTCANVEYMVQASEKYGIKVVLGTIPPWGCQDNQGCGNSLPDETPARFARIVDLNNFLKAFAAQENLTLVDYHTILEDSTALHYAQGLSTDGVHPSPEGYQLMTPAATAAVQ